MGKQQLLSRRLKIIGQTFRKKTTHWTHFFFLAPSIWWCNDDVAIFVHILNKSALESHLKKKSAAREQFQDLNRIKQIASKIMRKLKKIVRVAACCFNLDIWSGESLDYLSPKYDWAKNRIQITLAIRWKHVICRWQTMPTRVLDAPHQKWKRHNLWISVVGDQLIFSIFCCPRFQNVVRAQQPLVDQTVEVVVWVGDAGIAICLHLARPQVKNHQPRCGQNRPRFSGTMINHSWHLLSKKTLSPLVNP